MAEQTLDQKLIVVTGASRGIGYHSALQAAKQGAHVIALARTLGGLEELDDAIKDTSGAATLVPLDLRDAAGIDRLGGAIHERWGRLDGLIANAGILGDLSPLAHIKPDVWDEVMAVNVTANWRLIRSLDPLLRRASAARVLFLSSGAAWKCKPFWGPYSASKAAVEALAKTYAAETAKTTVKVNAFNPGPVRTAMRAKAMPGEDPESLPAPAEIAKTIIKAIMPEFDQSGTLINAPTGRAYPLLPGYAP